MVKFPIWTELVCATCARAGEGRYVFSGRVERRAMHQEAGRNGWLFAHNDVFCGEVCKGQFEKEQGVTA